MNRDGRGSIGVALDGNNNSCLRLDKVIAQDSHACKT